MRQVVLIVHNVRSAHNVGSLMRTAEGLGVKEVILTGYTPYPLSSNDLRLPHMAQKVSQRISKTALGAEKSVKWRYSEEINSVLAQLKQAGYTLAALEQANGSKLLNHFKPPAKVALLVGNEVDGMPSDLLAACDEVLEIPMRGRKESFNVSVAAAIALYHLTALDK